MSTIFASQRKDITGTNLTQSKSYNEGDAELLLDAITFDNEKDYTDVITLTLDVAGGDASFITLESTSEVAPIVATDPDTWTITSQYQKNNYTQNVHADLTSTLANLKITFNNLDASDSYTITVTLSDGHSSAGGTITVTGFAVVDAVNIVQNLEFTEDASASGAPSPLPAIADLDEAGKTYRVTLTSSDAAKCIIFAAPTSATATPDSTWTDSVAIEGTQAEINSLFDYSSGFWTRKAGPDNTDPFTITWLQEVITGPAGPTYPYTQENGLFSYTVTTTDAADTVVANLNYQEDTPTLDTIATLNDSRGMVWGAYDPTNEPKYTATVTLSNPASGSVDGWTDEGSGVYSFTSNNIDTFGTVNDYLMTAALNNFVFIPAADYASSLDTFSLLVTRDNQHGDPTWYTTGKATQQTLINETGITLTATAHDEFAPIGSKTYVEDVDTDWNFGSITDLAANKTYTMTLTVSDVNAIDTITNWTPGVAGVWTYTGTASQCDIRMASVVARPSADYAEITYNITYNQNQDTDGIDQGSEVVVVTNAGVHAEFAPNGNLSYDEDVNTNWNIGAVSDLAIGKLYTLTLTFSATDAIDTITNWTPGVAGVWTYTGTKANCNIRLASVVATPSADYTGAYTYNYNQNQDTDGIDQITTSNYNVTLGVQHDEYTVPLTTLNVGEYSVTELDFGSIDDLASGKTYTITLVLSDVTKGTIGAPWSVGVPGTYTLSGTKAYLNGQLAAVPFDTTSLGDDVDTGSLTVSYNQNQDTDSIAQGYTAVAATLNFVGVVDATNITQSGLVIVEDEYLWTFSSPPQINDQLGAGSGRTYRVTLEPNTGGDDVYDLSCTSSYVTSSTYASTITMEGTQAQLNNVLDGTDGGLHIDKTTVDDQTDFTIKYTQEVLVGGVGTAVDYTQELGSFAFDVTPDVNSGYTVDTTYNTWNVDTASPLNTIATITDTRGDQFDAATIIYTALVFSKWPGQFGAGDLSSGGTGGTSTWNTNVLLTGTAEGDTAGVTDSVNIVGTGTLFTSEFAVGDKIAISYSAGTIVSIADDTHLVVDTAVSKFITNGSVSLNYAHTLVLTGTKTQVNSHLAAITWTGLGGFSDAFTMSTMLFRNINSNGRLIHKDWTDNILMDSGNGATNQSTGHTYDEDVKLSL